MTAPGKKGAAESEKSWAQARGISSSKAANTRRSERPASAVRMFELDCDDLDCDELDCDESDFNMSGFRFK